MKINTESKKGKVIISILDIVADDCFEIDLSFKNNFKGNPYKRRILIQKDNDKKTKKILFIRPDKKLISSANKQGHFWIHAIENAW